MPKPRYTFGPEIYRWSRAPETPREEHYRLQIELLECEAVTRYARAVDEFRRALSAECAMARAEKRAEERRERTAARAIAIAMVCEAARRPGFARELRAWNARVERAREANAFEARRDAARAQAFTERATRYSDQQARIDERARRDTLEKQAKHAAARAEWARKRRADARCQRP